MIKSWLLKEMVSIANLGAVFISKYMAALYMFFLSNISHVHFMMSICLDKKWRACKERNKGS